MIVDIKVPSAGESVSEATISRIIKKSGSYVKSEDEILELETDKVNQVVYAPAEGVIQINVKVDDIVQVDQIVGHIDTEAKKFTADSVKSESHDLVSIKSSSSKSSELASSTSSIQDTQENLIKPDEAVEESISQSSNSESSGETHIDSEVSKDVVTRRRMTGLRKTIAEKLVEAKNQTAMLTTFNELDMSNIMEIRKREQEAFLSRNGVKLGFMSFFVKAAVAALKEFPDLNSFIEGDEIVTFQSYDICIAVSTEKGLMVPVIRNCDKKSYGEIEKSIAEFAIKAREGSISIDDMRGGSFTITNGGVFGSMLSTPILNPPQSAILGMHTIVKRPVVIKDKVVIRPIMYLALSYDHRIIDGRDAIQFLVHMKGNLEEPTRMLIDL